MDSVAVFCFFAFGSTPTSCPDQRSTLLGRDRCLCFDQYWLVAIFNNDADLATTWLVDSMATWVFGLASDSSSIAAGFLPKVDIVTESCNTAVILLAGSPLRQLPSKESHRSCSLMSAPFSFSIITCFLPVVWRLTVVIISWARRFKSRTANCSRSFPANYKVRNSDSSSLPRIDRLQIKHPVSMQQ